VPDTPRYAICELAFPDTTLAEDLEIARKANATGISVDEWKTEGRDMREVAAELREAGLKAACCIPYAMSFLPGPEIKGPSDVEERVASICESVRRLAVLEPDAILCLTGPCGDLSSEEARRVAGEALRMVADTADEVGVQLSFETFRFSDPQNYSFVFGLEEAVQFLAEAGRPDVPLCYDIWHVWDSSPRILEQTRELAPRINTVHLNDYREPTRAWADRVLPGDGVVDLPAIFHALRQGGFDGWFDLEVFSDDGRWGDDLPDSVWKLPWLEQAQRGYEGLMKAWSASLELDAVR
jgi:sugar phosphate isomerase/epimerase